MEEIALTEQEIIVKKLYLSQLYKKAEWIRREIEKTKDELAISPAEANKIQHIAINIVSVVNNK